MKFISIEQASSMIGKKVRAKGVCGTMEDITVIGILDRLEYGEAIVNIIYGKSKFNMPCLASRHTLELVNGSCGNCDNDLSDAEAFNQICFECGKKV